MLQLFLLVTGIFMLEKEPVQLFPKEFAYVILYQYNQGEIKSRPEYHVYTDETGFAASISGQGDTLERPTVLKLEALFKKGTNGLIEGIGKCFIPRHGLVFFNEQHQPISSMSICFECDRIAFWNRKKGEVHLKEKMNIKRAEQQMEELKIILRHKE